MFPKVPFLAPQPVVSLALLLFKDIRNCFCASLLRTKFTRHVIHRARVRSSKVNNNKANGHCYNFAWI